VQSPEEYYGKRSGMRHWRKKKREPQTHLDHREGGQGVFYKRLYFSMWEKVGEGGPFAG